MKEWETDKFIKNVLQQLWPHWEPTNQEREVWMSLLKYAEYDPTAQKITNWFAHSVNPGWRPLPGMLEHLFVHPPEPGSNDVKFEFKEGACARAFRSILSGPELRPSPSGSGQMVATKRWLEKFLVDYPDLLPGV